MATITERKKADGSSTFKAEVRLKQDGKIIYQETKSFPRKASAMTWASKLEKDLKRTDAVTSHKQKTTSLKTLIQMYRETVDAIKPLGKTKRSVLGILENSNLAQTSLDALNSKSIVDHCIARKSSYGAGPVTINIDFIYISTVLKSAKPMFNIAVETDVVEEARVALKRLGLIRKSRSRDRRIDPEELSQLLAVFHDRHQKHGSFIPMADIVEFAIDSCMRQGEITNLRWQDIDHTKKTIIIRDRKDPQDKQGNDQVVPLLGKCLEIIERQPKKSDRVFPYKAQSIGTAFRVIVQALGFSNLKFHDLRHEGTSRRFEQGYKIQEVAIVTGHKDWNMLRRYTNLRPESLHKAPATLSQLKNG